MSASVNKRSRGGSSRTRRPALRGLEGRRGMIPALFLGGEVDAAILGDARAAISTDRSHTTETARPPLASISFSTAPSLPGRGQNDGPVFASSGRYVADAGCRPGDDPGLCRNGSRRDVGHDDPLRSVGSQSSRGDPARTRRAARPTSAQACRLRRSSRIMASIGASCDRAYEDTTNASGTCCIGPPARLRSSSSAACLRA